MSFGRIENYFESMRRVMEFRFVLPDDARYMVNPDGSPNRFYSRPAKTLLLLNGYTHNSLEWLAHTQIFDLAGKYNVAVLMPSGENGFYLNREGGNEHFADFVGDELIKYASGRFSLSGKREDQAVCGVSMGGFGSLHTGLAYPENFSRIAALSPALILYEISGAKKGFSNGGGDYGYYTRIFGDLDTVLERDPNPEYLVKKLLDEGKDIPQIFMACGTEDFLLGYNRRFHEFLGKLGVPCRYYESSGAHDYTFWNQYVEKAMLWLIGEDG
ncbi:MAG: alpha/beta hydrolase [Oscillospiraceae bacterium]|jgi:putative tributyrin esterase